MVPNRHSALTLPKYALKILLWVLIQTQIAWYMSPPVYTGLAILWAGRKWHVPREVGLKRGRDLWWLCSCAARGLDSPQEHRVLSLGYHPPDPLVRSVQALYDLLSEALKHHNPVVLLQPVWECEPVSMSAGPPWAGSSWTNSGSVASLPCQRWRLEPLRMYEGRLQACYQGTVHLWLLWLGVSSC